MSNQIATVCKSCGGKSFSKWGIRDGKILYQCDNCELVFFYPYPTQEELDAFYNSPYHAQRGYSGAGEAGELRKAMYALDISDLNKNLPGGGKFLDVGCAEGVFLSMLGEEWEKYGIDCSKVAIEKAREKAGITAAAQEITELEEKAFAVVHLRGVFEHMLEPAKFMQQANRRLRDGGTLVLSNTPNIGGLAPRLFRGRFRLVLPNEHVHYFSSKTMRTLAEGNGFEITSITYPYFGTPYCSFWRDLLSLPLNYFTGMLSPPFYGNIFTVYARKVRDV